MTFKDKIKHMLHPSGNKKSSPPSTPTSSTSTSTPVSQTPYKPDPNKPPNARDPGFRKSFNLSEERPSTEGPITEPASEPDSTPPSAPQNVPVNGNGNGNHKMYTLDRYGEDYLAVSPRTNITVPEGTNTNTTSSGLSAVSPLDGEAKAALGTIQERKPTNNTNKDPVSGAAQRLDEMSLSQQDPNYGRDQFASGDREGGGFIEPVTTRDPAVANASPDRQHPTTFKLESQPAFSQYTSSTDNSVTKTTTREPTDSKTSNLLSAPPSGTGDGSPSNYSNESSSRPTLTQAPSSVYSQTAASSPPPLNPSSLPEATVHQQQYTSLVSDIVPDVEPIDSQHGALQPNNGFPASLGATENTEGSLFNSKSIPKNTSKNSAASIEQQAEAFADLVGAHLASLKTPTESATARDPHESIPDAASVGENTKSTGRPVFKHGESVLEVTKDMPGSFSV